MISALCWAGRADPDAHDERPRSRRDHHGLFRADGRCSSSPRWCRSSGSRRPGPGSASASSSASPPPSDQWIVVLAYRYGDASVLAPFSYTQLLWVSILGFFVFGEVPDVWTMHRRGLHRRQRSLHCPPRARAPRPAPGAGRAFAERLTQYRARLLLCYRTAPTKREEPDAGRDFQER